MTGRSEKLLAGLVLGLLLAFAITAQFMTPDGTEADGSAGSAEPEGRRALYLLLRDLGFRAEAWTEAPGALPRGGGLVWMARTPSRPVDRFLDEATEDEHEHEHEEESEDEPSAEEEAVEQPEPAPPSPASVGVRASAHYRRFLEEGGTILLDLDDRSRQFLVEELGLDVCGDVQASVDTPSGPRRFRDHRGEELEVDVEGGGVLLPPPAGSSAEALWWDGDLVLATMLPVGGGQIVLLGDDSAFSNARIAERDHALFAVRLAEQFARDGRILFDEYALGLWRPRTAVTLLGSPALLLATLHVAALLLLGLWSAAWVREFPRDPRPLETATPLLRARSLASLLARAGRFDVLGRHLGAGAKRRLARVSDEAERAAAELEAAPCRDERDLERRAARIRELECRRS